MVIGGPGDPCAWTGFVSFTRRLTRRTDRPTCALVPGPLLTRPTIRDALARYAVVAVKLDAGSPQTMMRINRPARGVRFPRLVESLVEFRRVFRGRFIIQSVLLPGFNDAPADVEALATLMRRLNPSDVLLVHPAGDAGDGALPASRIATGPALHVHTVCVRGSEGGTEGEELPRVPCWVLC